MLTLLTLDSTDLRAPQLSQITQLGVFRKVSVKIGQPKNMGLLYQKYGGPNVQLAKCHSWTNGGSGG